MPPTVIKHLDTDIEWHGQLFSSIRNCSGWHILVLPIFYTRKWETDIQRKVINILKTQKCIVVWSERRPTGACAPTTSPQIGNANGHFPMVSLTTPILIHFELICKNCFNFTYTPRNWSNIHFNSIFSFLIRFSKSKNYITHLSFNSLNIQGMLESSECCVIIVIELTSESVWCCCEFGSEFREFFILWKYHANTICVPYVYHTCTIHVLYTTELQLNN